METSMTSLPSPEECRWPFYNFKSFLQFQIYSFHSVIESFARRSLRIFPLFTLNMFSFIHAVILLGEVQEGGEGCQKSQRTKDVSFYYNSKVKFWIKFPNIFSDLAITIITWYFVNQEPPISKMSSLRKEQNPRYRKNKKSNSKTFLICNHNKISKENIEWHFSGQ